MILLPGFATEPYVVSVKKYSRIATAIDNRSYQ